MSNGNKQQDLPISKYIGRSMGALARALRKLFAGRNQFHPMDQVQLALVIPLADQAACEVTRLQVEILRKYGRNPGLEAFPHITLKMGFRATDIRPFEEFVEKLASEIPPFEITVNGFDSFDDGILFLNVEENRILKNLRQRILGELSTNHGVQAEPIEGAQFRFHITMAYGFSPSEFQTLRKVYASRELRFTFRASHIDLFCHTGQQWVTYAHALLRNCPHSIEPLRL